MCPGCARATGKQRATPLQVVVLLAFCVGIVYCAIKFGGNTNWEADQRAKAQAEAAKVQAEAKRLQEMGEAMKRIQADRAARTLLDGGR